MVFLRLWERVWVNVMELRSRLPVLCFAGWFMPWGRVFVVGCSVCIHVVFIGRRLHFIVQNPINCPLFSFLWQWLSTPTEVLSPFRTDTTYCPPARKGGSVFSIGVD